MFTQTTDGIEGGLAGRLAECQPPTLVDALTESISESLRGEAAASAEVFERLSAQVARLEATVAASAERAEALDGGTPLLEQLSELFDLTSVSDGLARVERAVVEGNAELRHAMRDDELVSASERIEDRLARMEALLVTVAAQTTIASAPAPVEEERSFRLTEAASRAQVATEVGQRLQRYGMVMGGIADAVRGALRRPPVDETPAHEGHITLLRPVAAAANA